MKKQFFVVAAVIIGSQLCTASYGQAQHDTTVLDEAIVTANKFEQKQSQTGKVVSVITKEQLEKSGSRTVAQLLNEQAGINIAGVYTATGGVQTVFMRGASSGRTLILVDGIPVSDPSMINNEFDLNLFSINDIERIEICKGAQSTMYGSDAIAGAINIITIKKDIKKSFNLKLTAGLGNTNTVRNNIQLYGKAGKLTYTTRFGKLSTDGFSAATDKNGNGNFDKDGYDGNVINASVQYQIVPSLSVKTFIQHSQYKADIDAGVFADDKDYTINNSSLSSGFGAAFKKGIVAITGNYQYGEQARKYLNDSLFPRPALSFVRNNYDSRTQYAELFGSVMTAKWLTVIAGADYRWAFMKQKYFSISGFGPYDPPLFDSSVHQTSLYGSLHFSAINKRLNVEIGGRANKHSRYGNNSTYTFNPSFSITSNWRVFGSIASGFKTPSIFQLYDVFSGNPDLKAERSINYEIGIQNNYEKITSRVAYFHRDIKNGIDYNNATFQYFNYIKQIVNGLEFEVAAKPTQKLTISANYTLIRGKEQTQSRKSFNDTSYNHLLRRPRHSINFTFGYQFTSKLFANISGKSTSSRYDVAGYQEEDVQLDKYFLLNAYAEYKCRPNLKFFIDAQNLANKKFVDLRGYNAIPFLINGGISFEL